MARPLSFDRDEAELQMRDVFWRKGYTGTSIQDVVEVTGIRSGSLHAVFGKKDRLYAAALARYDARFEAAFDVPGRGCARIVNYLDGLAEAVIADPERRGCLIVQGALEAAAHSPDNAAQLKARLERMADFMRDRLAEDGRADDDTVAGALGAAVAILTLGRTEAPAETVRGIVRHTARTLNAPT